MLRRNVRVTPLPGFGDGDALEFLAEFPSVCVFSSDYPHQEGNADPIELYRPALDALDDELRASFLGENMAACFARTGDPIGP
jgi:predicted TIM-barrel fold metal-dependent hydrolase